VVAEYVTEPLSGLVSGPQSTIGVVPPVLVAPPELDVPPVATVASGLLALV